MGKIKDNMNEINQKGLQIEGYRLCGMPEEKHEHNCLEFCKYYWKSDWNWFCGYMRQK